MGFLSRHRRLILFGIVAAVALGVFVVVWFQPQKVVIEKRVNEAAPTPAATAVTTQTPAPERKGTFTGIEHPTTGTARVISTNGKQVLRFEDFNTSNGPDVVVYLSSASATERGRKLADDFVDLGQLKGNIGDQNYSIPSGTDLDKYSTVVVWCRRFTVAFGVADLS